MGRRVSRRVARAALAAALATILLAACGGSSGPTKAEYTKQAAAICRDANDSVTKVRADATTTSALAASIGRVVSIEQDAARRVRALRAPKGDEAVLRQWLGLVDETLDELDTASHAAAAGDGAAANAANQRAQALDRQADGIATRYGLDACAATG
jgi:hypothetical protein